MNLPELRENYTMAGLSRADLSNCPFTQFEQWMEQALSAGLIEPNAMTLATADAGGHPSSRTVLLKGMDQNGFRFFTNYTSKKARDLQSNPHASLTFLWKELERQVCIRGKVTKTSREISEKYFHSRPYGSQIGAWVSESQSSEVPDRAFLQQQDEKMMARFPEGETVPLPDFWGGYQLEPTHLEFWQGRPGRLHDRFCYTLTDEVWKISRLSP